MVKHGWWGGIVSSCVLCPCILSCYSFTLLCHYFHALTYLKPVSLSAQSVSAVMSFCIYHLTLLSFLCLCPGSSATPPIGLSLCALPSLQTDVNPGLSCAKRGDYVDIFDYVSDYLKTDPDRLRLETAGIRDMYWTELTDDLRTREILGRKVLMYRFCDIMRQTFSGQHMLTTPRLYWSNYYKENITIVSARIRSTFGQETYERMFPPSSYVSDIMSNRERPRTRGE